MAAEDGGLAGLFTAGILARLPSPVLWCLRWRDLFAPYLVGVSLMPGRVIFAETWNDAEVLPAMEVGLRTFGLTAVEGEVTSLRLICSRRLQRWAERTGIMALVIRHWGIGT
ncbi:hypothetical protein [Methylorubrum extorquens]|uniref:Uncharacterized protein n=1 Tax=Methylorubrum extorquens (strain ATCC 14718 / DSM 1338 / JCM 2805 / NCIMB 9133 / AM1) TaxID=272630 RepID=C5B377_METEA|nr:hypothetical protein [Methylorubrum extorquens]ACS38029.1 conserved hypothetical protein [Methylorubrum extorquens AM1]MCP1543928.1 protein ImuA [Methylorubrum extorquens]MCP1588726.1 protein ImuA [Methylorubrum extorquens]